MRQSLSLTKSTLVEYLFLRITYYCQLTSTTKLYLIVIIEEISIKLQGNFDQTNCFDYNLSSLDFYLNFLSGI